jgi:hypothetical protein
LNTDLSKQQNQVNVKSRTIPSSTVRPDSRVPSSAEPAPRKKSENLASSPLAESDYRDLEEQSWISQQVADEAGLYRVTHQQALEHGIPKIGHGDLSGIMFPYRDPESGNNRGYRLRRDNPDLEVKEDGTRKPRGKYLSPMEQRNLLYFPPGLPPGWMPDPSVSLVIVEGEKKTLAVHILSSHGLGDAAEQIRHVTVGFSGAWSWRGRVGKETNSKGKIVDVYGPISDLDRIAWKGRNVTIWSDANFWTNQAVYAGWTRLAQELTRRGAIVRFASCPDQPGISGPDDALARLGPEWGLKELNSTWETSESPVGRIPRTENAVQTLHSYDCGEFLQLQLHDEEDYVVQGLVPKGGAILLYAMPKSLKT